jgi:hypothetical protein
MGRINRSKIHDKPINTARPIDVLDNNRVRQGSGRNYISHNDVVQQYRAQQRALETKNQKLNKPRTQHQSKQEGQQNSEQKGANTQYQKEQQKVKI